MSRPRRPGQHRGLPTDRSQISAKRGYCRHFRCGRHIPPVATRRLLGNAVKVAFAPQVKLLLHQRGRGAERVVEAVERQRGVVAVMTQDDCHPISAADVNASRGADGGGKDFADAFQAERFATRLAGHWVETGKDVLIMPQEIERVVVKQGGRNIRSHAIQLPGNISRAGDVTFGAGEANSEHGLRIIAVSRD